MCSIILSVTASGVFAAANRDEMAARPWETPAEYWPGICGGRDVLAGGTWLALNRAGVMAAVLNREGTLGPAPGKRSRGELPLLALAAETAAAGAQRIGALDAGLYRAFNMVVADKAGAFFIRGLGEGKPDVIAFAPGVHMLTAGEPDDVARPRIARHLPRFMAAPIAQWGALLAERGGAREEQLNIDAAENDGFGTVCASLVNLPRNGTATHDFAAGPPDRTEFRRIEWDAGMELTIEQVTGPHYEMRALITELEAYLAGLYLPEQLHGWSYERLLQPDVKFFLIRRGARAVGCGGIALYDDFAEVKRLFTVQDERGNGVGRVLLARLEEEARAAGKSWLRLETGDAQRSAMRLFEVAGFEQRHHFGPYADMKPLELATSRFYQKKLGE